MSALDALVVPSVCEVDGAEMDSGVVTIQAHVRTLDGVCPLCLSLIHISEPTRPY